MPFGFNKTVWIRNQLPAIPDNSQVLYLANGLEDVAIYIDNELVYSFGDFSRSWGHAAPQTWHAVSLKPEQSGKTVLVRTHYALGYLTRTLYPSIEPQAPLLLRHVERSLLTIWVSGGFGLMGIMAFYVVILRRKFDLFFNFAVMITSTSLWMLFNQDSLIKCQTGFNPKAWGLLDLNALAVAAPCLFTFLADIAQSRHKVVIFFLTLNWVGAALVLFFSIMPFLHCWYVLPYLHIVIFTSLLIFMPMTVRSAIRRNSEARILMSGSITLGFAVIHDMLRYTSVFKSPMTSMIPVGITFLFASMVVLLLRRYQAERGEAYRTQTRLLQNIQHLNEELQEHVERVKALVEEKTRDIRSILGNIRQGIFMLTGPDLRFHAEYSGFLESLLGRRDLGGLKFEDCFLDLSQLGEDQKNHLVSVLEVSLGEQLINFEINCSSLPGEMTLNVDGHAKFVELTWAPMIDDEGEIEKILVTARDVTSWRQLQSAARKSEEQTRMLQTILSVKAEQFSRFLKASRQLLKQIFQSLDTGTNLDEQEFKAIYRNLHTMKGNARSFNLKDLANIIHRSEQCVHELLVHGSQKGPWSELQNLTQDIDALINQYHDAFYNTLGLGRDADQICLARAELEVLMREQITLAGSKGLEPIGQRLLPQVFVSAEQFFAELEVGASKIAEYLEKLPPRIEVRASGYYFPRATEDLLLDCFGHLLRNALDHGLETVAERTAMDKAPQGCLWIELYEASQELKIRFKDDGRGLDVRKIKRRGQALGILSEDEALTLDVVERLIFLSGFTTKSEASINSGRGVGLDAVRAYLEERSGSIRIRLVDSDEMLGIWHVLFEITLPQGSFLADPHSRHMVRAS
ncbi:MAG TPA: Hpt domain-containing protein [Oligoflexus sp.]|uniref:Hpt domain-containing protein n=1 Tax=Oligoflexus sp. TaxID=1971216 RepID=UPI002D30DFD6|nr:Hpt domain-containing protein [Oligoflexus sp.]HYX33904.1 Hpt domain-containing protein [Oligoflexus sp.]